MYSKFKEELQHLRKYVGSTGYFSKLDIGLYDIDREDNELIHKDRLNYAPVHNLLETQLVEYIIKSEGV